MISSFRLRLAMYCATAVVAVAAYVPLVKAAEPVFPPASRIGIIPPRDFVLSQSIPGFQHTEKQASILMADLPGYAFEGIEKQVAAELQKDAAAPATRREIEFKDGGRGFVLFGKPSGPQGTVLKWTMVAHVRDVTAVVTALVPEAVQDVASDQAIRESFASLTVRTAVPVEEQLSVLPFSINQMAGFRIVRVQPGSAAMLTDGPKDAVEANEQPLLLLSIMPAQNQPQPHERDGIARRLIGEIPGIKDIRVTRAEPLRIAGQQGYEIALEAKDAKTGIDLNAVQWLRFGTGTLLRIVGMTRKDVWGETYPRFRQVRDGIGPK